MSDTYTTFLRSATDWKSFSSAPKITQDTDLSYADARKQCEDYNKNRTPEQIAAGTKMEFTAE